MTTEAKVQLVGDKFKCLQCGAMVTLNTTKCPRCGVDFGISYIKSASTPIEDKANASRFTEIENIITNASQPINQAKIENLLKRLQKLDLDKQQDYKCIMQSLGREKDKYEPERLLDALETSDDDAEMVLMMLVISCFATFFSLFLTISLSSLFFGILIIIFGCLAVILVATRSVMIPRRTESGEFDDLYMGWLKRRAKYDFWMALLIQIGWVIGFLIVFLFMFMLVLSVRGCAKWNSY